jgi:hypothetical protein
MQLENCKVTSHSAGNIYTWMWTSVDGGLQFEGLEMIHIY